MFVFLVMEVRVQNIIRRILHISDILQISDVFKRKDPFTLSIQAFELDPSVQRLPTIS